MIRTRPMLAAAAGIAALAATPAAAQYPYGYANPYGSQYGYANRYASPYGYANPYGHDGVQMATQRCAAAVQNRLNNRRDIGSILGAVLGGGASRARVVAFTEVDPRRGGVRVRGVASSGRMAGYGPYGVGAYGAAGYGYQPDLKFKCDVDYRGYVREVTIRRR